MTLFEKIKDLTGDTKSLEDYAREECIFDYWPLEGHFDDKETSKICTSGCKLSECIKCWNQEYIENDNESICDIKVGQKFKDKNTGCIKEILRVGDGMVEYTYLNNKTDKIKIGAITCGKKLFLDENNLYDEKETTREIMAGEQDKKELISSAQLIRRYCNEQIACGACLFCNMTNEGYECALKEYPYEWHKGFKECTNDIF